MDEPLCFKGLESLTLHEETETGWYNETSIEELTEFISRRFEESRKKERTTLGKEPPWRYLPFGSYSRLIYFLERFDKRRGFERWMGVSLFYLAYMGRPSSLLKCARMY
jgi:hypothetical protein